jgi:Icc-related predicted phosphoesterase
MSDLVELLESAGVVVLDGEAVEVSGVGFAGVKGFGGGLGRGRVDAFGEAATKQYVRATFAEVDKLDDALGCLSCEHKVVLLHYAPVEGTLAGEPEVLWPFLGSSRLAEVIDRHGASVVFHGHAHLGAPEGSTVTGVPVFNVAAPVLQRCGLTHRRWSVELSRQTPLHEHSHTTDRPSSGAEFAHATRAAEARSSALP